MTKPTTKPAVQDTWTALYNTEAQLRHKKQVSPLRKVGRPPSPLKRTRLLSYQTDSELRILNEIESALKEQFQAGKMTHGMVIGFALRLMADQIEKKNNAEVLDWQLLWEKITK